MPLILRPTFQPGNGSGHCAVGQQGSVVAVLVSNKHLKEPNGDATEDEDPC